MIQCIPGFYVIHSLIFIDVYNQFYHKCKGAKKSLIIVGHTFFFNYMGRTITNWGTSAIMF